MDNNLLPMFPLQLVAFPGEKLNLHVFEPRYKQLVQHCQKTGSTFGIPPFLDKKLMDFGTELRIVDIDKTYPDGKMDIKTEGVGIFRVEQFFNGMEGRLFAGATVERMPLDYEGDFMLTNKLIDKISELFQIMNIKKEIPENTPGFNTYQVAHHVGFNVNQEYEFLRIPKEVDRQQFMLRHFQRLLPVVREMEELRKRVQMNGHFKNAIPPDFKL